MGTLYITEFSQIERVAGKTVQAPTEPPTAEQVVNYSASTQSAKLNFQTRIVRIHTDSPCHIAVGENPTATTNSRKMIADQTEYFSIPKNTKFKIAAIDAV